MAKLEYLFKIIYLLQAGNLLTAKAMGDRLGISDRNTRAYINTLMNADIPIMSVNGRRGGYYLDKNYFLKVPDLVEDEIVGLQIVRNMMDNPHEYQFTVEMVSAISKVLLTAKRCKENVECQQFRNMDNENSQKILTLAHRAITQRRKIKIVYQGMKEEAGTTRIICPYEIKFKDMAWYVYAFCEMRQQRRLFNIARVREADLLATYFHMDDDEAFTQDMGKAFGLFRGTKEYAVKIKFAYPASQWVKERLWLANQQIEEMENKAILYTCNVEGLETIERWVLRYGDMAQVVEPVELRARIKATLGRMMAKY